MTISILFTRLGFHFVSFVRFVFDFLFTNKLIASVLQKLANFSLKLRNKILVLHDMTTYQFDRLNL